jgi:hypothetical protein
VWRRWKIRLADAEIDDVAALALQLGRARQNRERVLLADAREAWDGMEHGVSPTFSR